MSSAEKRQQMSRGDKNKDPFLFCLSTFFPLHLLPSLTPLILLLTSPELPCC